MSGRTRLTVRRLRALQFAMSLLRAGDVEATLQAAPDVSEDDLAAAEEWVTEEIMRREKGVGDGE